MMRKLGRMVRRVLTAVSLLLFVAVLAAWVRGYMSPQSFLACRQSITDGTGQFLSLKCEETRGVISVLVEEWDSNDTRLKDASLPQGTHWDFARDIYPSRLRQQFAAKEYVIIAFHGNSWHWTRLGLSISHVRGLNELQGVSNGAAFIDAMSRCTLIIFPCWLAAIVFGALPSWRGLVWWRGVRRRRVAAREGRCGVCGYDLRASPGRCPECGTAVGGKGE